MLARWGYHVPVWFCLVYTTILPDELLPRAAADDQKKEMCRGCMLVPPATSCHTTINMNIYNTIALLAVLLLYTQTLTHRVQRQLATTATSETTWTLPDRCDRYESWYWYEMSTRYTPSCASAFIYCRRTPTNRCLPYVLPSATSSNSPALTDTE